MNSVRQDVDLVAGTITINQQIRHGVLGTPKGRTRRVVPMTPTLLAALKALQVVRTGHVLRNADGSPVSDSQARDAMYRICRLAGLPERGWHVLRHRFGTHAAMLGVNPWRLQTWMGHMRVAVRESAAHPDTSLIRRLTNAVRCRSVERELDNAAGDREVDETRNHRQRAVAR